MSEDMWYQFMDVMIVVCTITVIVSGCTIAILVFLFDRSIYEYVYSMFIKRSKDK